MASTENARDSIIELDALRGLAVIGIVLMSVYAFALPSQAYYNPLPWGGESDIDYTVWWAGFVFIEDKFHALFAMMFGTGTAVLLERAENKPIRRHMVRMLVLFAIGMVHGILLADNDVLRAYAVAGLLLPAFMRLRPSFLAVSAVVLVIVHVVFGSFYAFAQTAQYWEMNYGTNAFGLEVTYARGEETLGERIDRRIARLPRTITVILANIPLNLASMLVGVAAWKSGLFEGKWSMTRLLLVGSMCVTTSVFALGYYASEASGSGFSGKVIAQNSLLLSAPFDLLLSFGYAVLMMALLSVARGRMPVRVLADTGRLWVTNYLMTSVILAAIFASWGLGLFGTVSRSEALLFSFVPIVMVLVWSPIWVRYIGRGPFERLWRGGSRLIA
ncbi:MAG: DUF418 domain-containing protein [Pseudomonadota bacterium]